MDWFVKQMFAIFENIYPIVRFNVVSFLLCLISTLIHLVLFFLYHIYTSDKWCRTVSTKSIRCLDTSN